MIIPMDAEIAFNITPFYDKKKLVNQEQKGGPKMAEEQDKETTFSSTNSLKEHFNAEQIPQNNF